MRKQAMGIRVPFRHLKFALLAFILFSTSFVKADESTADSLLELWNDANLHDSIRLDAFYNYTWLELLESNPDSAFINSQTICRLADEKHCFKQFANGVKLQAVVYLIQGNYDSAMVKFEYSHSLYTDLKDQKGIARTHIYLGMIYANQGDHYQALKHYRKGYELFEKIGFAKGIADGKIAIGSIYYQQNKLSEALEYFEEARDIYISNKNQKELATALSNIGNVYYSLEKTDQALEAYSESLKIYKLLGKDFSVAKSYHTQAVIYNELEKFDTALAIYSKSLAISTSFENFWMMSTTYVDIGNIHYALRNYDSALYWCSKALELSTTNESVETQKNACECLYISYKAKGDQSRALEFHEQYLQLRDKLTNTETAEQLRQMEFANQLYADSIRQAQEDYELQIRHQKEVNRFIIIGIVFLIAALLLLNRLIFVRRSRTAIAKEKERSDELLLNILPEEIAKELKETGQAAARNFENVSILFTDFKNFTQISEKMPAEDLINELNYCFKAFDDICDRFGIEKIKTIGDSYMAAGGLPVSNPDSLKNTVLAGLEMIEVVKKLSEEGNKSNHIPFEMRCGIHTGKVAAGIVGHKKFQYDVWGDTVNTASRMESNGVEGAVNISSACYDALKDDPQFEFIDRGKVNAKGKGEVNMYLVKLPEKSISL